MARKMIVNKDGAPHSLTEAAASNEFELQEIVKDNPDILPFEEFNITGPLMVVGRETTLPSGAVDLVGLARSGDLLMIEFKTGPQNTDFRAALAQLLDYGSDLWGMSYDEFQSTIPVRYFSSNRCKEITIRGKTSLLEAQKAFWSDMEPEELSFFKGNLSKNLENGVFHYLLVASRFTKSIERTIRYLNYINTAVQFYAIELVSFTGDAVTAYETRTLVKPEVRGGNRPSNSIDENELLDAISDEHYRDDIREFFEICRALRLNFYWGVVGVSIRLATSDSPEPISIGWITPPGKTGWMSLSGLTLGYDTSSVERVPSVKQYLEEYVTSLSSIDGAVKVRPRNLYAYSLPSDVVKNNLNPITEIITELVRKTSEI